MVSFSDDTDLVLANGSKICSGWIDGDDPDALPAGDYLQVINAAGEEIFYAESADIFADPLEGRKILFRFLQACRG